MGVRQIELRGVRVNNLNEIDLDIPHGQFVSICGVSGSGKSSLAFETLFAEGQRRYFESLSTYTRQFLEQLDKPDADQIAGIPSAIALRANRHSAPKGIDRHRHTVADATELSQHLGLLFANIGQAFCSDCQRTVERHDPGSVLQFLKTLPPDTRYQIGFGISSPGSDEEWKSQLEILKANGFRRLLVNENTRTLEEAVNEDIVGSTYVIVDRLTTSGSFDRAIDSLRTAFDKGHNAVSVFWDDNSRKPSVNIVAIDGREWSQLTFFRDLICAGCQKSFPDPAPSLFNSSNPLGACPDCAGIGSNLILDMNRIVPDDAVSIEDGAIAPWNTPAYVHEKEELIALSGEFGIDIKCPFGQLNEDQLKLIWQGVPERDFGGLDGFFRWLERRKYKVQIGVFLNRWKSKETCRTCQGMKLNADALAFLVGEKNLYELCHMQVDSAHSFLGELRLDERDRLVADKVLLKIRSNLQFLMNVGLGYLQLDRLVQSLSSGESQRVMLTKILGSTLTSMLYVLDEPTSGLHADEIASLVDCIRNIADRGNTVVVVDHDEEMICGADRIIEIGPGAGIEGGNIIFDGSADSIVMDERSVTGHFIKRHSGLRDPSKPRRPRRGSICLTGAKGNNLDSLDCEIPLGGLCAVTGRSGSGKSSLVLETLYPALCHARSSQGPDGLPFDKITGANQIDHVVLVDQSPIGRSSRSNPVTYIKAFDEIRKTFADTAEARLRNYAAGHFSFNVDGGRCEKCQGAGQLTIDMQFMSDIHVRCNQCKGTRYRESVLEVKYRAKNIDEVLNMTAREAFTFFRGKTKVQAKIKALIDVGLEYIRLGQPATTLSAGEAQRLKLAHYLNAPKTQKALFIMDEPTFGLHMRDVIRLIDCFETLLAAGHTVIVIEHNMHLLKHADWIIDLGPGAAKDGGRIVAQGTPEAIAANEQSATGRHLKKLLAAEEESLSTL